MKITQYKDKKLNIFTNSSKPGFELYSDIYGDHFRVGNQVIGDFPKVIKLEDYLYEITVDEMDQEFGLSHATGIGACSEARHGNFQLRNYDWYLSQKTSFIVKVTANENRHASIGVSSISISKEDIANKNYSELFKVIPFTTLDGINDCGVYCGINVVPTGDKGRTTGTNKNGKDLPNICIPRYVLDNATSAEHAINLLKYRNIYAINYDGQQIELHAMISDINKTYIVEFVNNKMVVLEQDINSAVMTNFYHTDWNGEIKSVALGNTVEDTEATGLTPHAEGLERYLILKGGIESVDSLEGGLELMRQVNFTKAYDKSMLPFWYSELVGALGLTIYSTVAEYEPVVDIFIEMFNNRDRNKPNTWQTVHTSCYDLQNKSMVVCCQEGDEVHSYSLDANNLLCTNTNSKITWMNKV